MKKVVIIGSGPAGYPAALKLKQLGADVKIIENWTFGGTCLNRGCIPSKAILEIAHRYHNFKDIKDYTDLKEFNINLKWEKIKEHKNRTVEQIRTSLEKLFKMKNIEIMRGKAKLVSDKKVEVQTENGKIELEFDNLIIATGTKPFYPPPFDKYREFLTDSDKIFDLTDKPNKITIIGAGVIGLEMACFFNAVGTEVEVIDILPGILPQEDPQITRVLKTSFEKRGIKFHFDTKVTDIKISGETKTLILENGNSIETNEILIAAGRTAELKELNLEAAGIEYDRFIKVNQKMQTSNPSIYACGDINGISLLAHSATRQGEIAAENIMGENKEFDKNIVPNCIYTWPEFASVGINQTQAKEKQINIKVKRAYFQALGRAVASMNSEGMCQIIADEKDTVIGAQIVGGPATEIIHILALAVRFKLKLNELNSIIYAHPTMSEIIMEALNK